MGRLFASEIRGLIYGRGLLSQILRYVTFPFLLKDETISRALRPSLSQVSLGPF